MRAFGETVWSHTGADREPGKDVRGQRVPCYTQRAQGAGLARAGTLQHTEAWAAHAGWLFLSSAWPLCLAVRIPSHPLQEHNWICVVRQLWWIRGLSVSLEGSQGSLETRGQG